MIFLCCFLKKNMSKSNCCFQPNIMVKSTLLGGIFPSVFYIWHRNLEPMIGLRIPLLESSFRGRPYVLWPWESTELHFSPIPTWHKGERIGVKRRMMTKWEWTEKSGRFLIRWEDWWGWNLEGCSLRTCAPTGGPEISLGRSAQAQSRLCTLDTDGDSLLWSMQCSLTSKLVLAFFKTSCVLVTVITKEFPKAEITSGVHICLGCVCSKACLSLATQLGVS